ncbi:hypothetical protein KKI95_00120 [Xenorhabdus bovienii]|uniref:hypothetical protein n=1 Tax=Xenorhabdus bovienii TaxID=40576 RepID=UPI0023B30AF0|nr:hypothetical protein [Xenorhabdus bovienii]MDE9434393.1 hypothetical protein [Xenorhabdus bovienii]MDE9496687.1 hypothetical protein [Xenorhabdus bovienii]
MLFLNKPTVHALFRNQHGDDWIGGVHMISKFYEYIPFTLNGKRYIVELCFPKYLDGTGFYQDMLLNTVDGGYFIPKREHRIIRLLSLNDNHTLSLMKDVPPREIKPFLNILVESVFFYNSVNLNVNQYFFESTNNLGVLLEKHLPSMVPPGNELVFHREIAPPFYGFTIMQ